MDKSLIEAIGRRKAFELMENAVFLAIEENQNLGLESISNEKKVCVVGPKTTSLLVGGQRSSGQASSLGKSVPIA